MASGDQVGGPLPQDAEVRPVQRTVRQVVGHDEVVTEGQHGVGGPAVGGQELAEKGLFTFAALLDEALLDLGGRFLGEGLHQQVGVGAPGGEIENAFEASVQQVPDRRPGTRHDLEALGEVLGAEDACGPPFLDRGSDAVGADEFLGVAEPRRQEDRVELLDEGRLAAPPIEHAAVGIGEDDAHGGIGQGGLKAVEHGSGGMDQPAVYLRLRPVGRGEFVHRDAIELGSAPGGQNPVPYLRTVEVAGFEEPLTNLGDDLPRALRLV